MSSTKTPSKTLDSKPLDLLRFQVRLLLLIQVNLTCTSLQLLGSGTFQYFHPDVETCVQLL